MLALLLLLEESMRSLSHFSLLECLSLSELELSGASTVMRNSNEAVLSALPVIKRDRGTKREEVWWPTYFDLLLSLFLLDLGVLLRFAGQLFPLGLLPLVDVRKRRTHLVDPGDRRQVQLLPWRPHHHHHHINNSKSKSEKKKRK